jgi:osmotically-inducible protein OsmY
MIRKTVLFGLSVILAGATAMACTGSANVSVQAALSKDLAKHKNVIVEVDDCVATLTGEVDSYKDKLEIERQARKHHELTSVYVKVTVGGPIVDDAKLLEAVTWELKNDRNTKGDIFGAFSVGVVDGAVTVIGFARNPMVRDDALEVVAATKGVKDVIDNIRIDELPEVQAMMPPRANCSVMSGIYAPAYVGPTIPWQQ